VSLTLHRDCLLFQASPRYRFRGATEPDDDHTPVLHQTGHLLSARTKKGGPVTGAWGSAGPPARLWSLVLIGFILYFVIGMVEARRGCGNDHLPLYDTAERGTQKLKKMCFVFRFVFIFYLFIYNFSFFLTVLIVQCKGPIPRSPRDGPQPWSGGGVRPAGGRGPGPARGPEGGLGRADRSRSPPPQRMGGSRRWIGGEGGGPYPGQPDGPIGGVARPHPPGRSENTAPFT